MKAGSIASTQYLAVTAELSKLPGWTDKAAISEAMGKRNKRTATQINRSEFGGQAIKKYRHSKYSYKLKAASRYYADIAASSNAGCKGYGHNQPQLVQRTAHGKRQVGSCNGDCCGIVRACPSQRQHGLIALVDIPSRGYFEIVSYNFKNDYSLPGKWIYYFGSCVFEV